MSTNATRIAGLALGSAAIVLGGSAAAAATTTLGVDGRAAQGCRTSITATTSTSNPMDMEFYDNETYLGRVQVTNQQGKMQARIDWTPADTGDHTIIARAVGSYIAPEDQVTTLNVRVVSAADLGSSCLPLALG
ncbi:hypothetical protein [Nocardia sp. BMG51109]|uniref:hypothetical protein n=1 Tax=Nocardia sp. BMG51109 TaxID=1056816 RepID=UPI00046375BC|nr:hypothetical protein [Nocardia sp. BMG51109]